MSLVEGTRLDHYEIVAPIGAGGMGEVYRARDPRLDRDVAIKVLAATLVTDPDLHRRFEQEARAAATLNHPNILAIHDVGRHDGTPYLVSELLEGNHAARAPRRRPAVGAQGDRLRTPDRPRSRGRARARESSTAISSPRIYSSLSTAASRFSTSASPRHWGHRRGGTDHGRATGDEDRNVLGTIGYMAPEQIRGLPADHRADIFAFGCVLYEMLGGRRAFSGRRRPTR